MLLEPLDLASVAVGVGHSRTASRSSVPRFPSAGRSPLIEATGVGHNPDSFADVRRTDGTSRNNKRPAGVVDAFQIRQHLVESHADVTSNILCNDPSGPDSGDESQHVRPEVTVIRRALALPGLTEGLARVATYHDVRVNRRECADVIVAWHVWPVLFEDAPAIRVDLAELHRTESARRFEPEAESADPAEKIEYGEHRSLTAGCGAWPRDR